MQIILGSDYEGFQLKNSMKVKLLNQGYMVKDKSEKSAVDFIESTFCVAEEILQTEKSLGIAFDGYGVGSFMVATKFKGLTAASVTDERTAYMTRQHNNTRLITLGAHIIGNVLAWNIIKSFLTSTYEGGRHQIRLDMLNKMLINENQSERLRGGVIHENCDRL